jgi:hypothetical protein
MKEIFKVFQDKEAYFESLSSDNKSEGITLKQIGVIFLFAFVYGMIMGSYNSFLQAVVSGFKVPILLFLALFICFPAFYVIQYMLGSRMSFKQMINMVLSGFVVQTTIMVSFAPIVIFFMITGNNYSFLKLLHVGIIAFSGVFGMRTMIEALKFSCEKKNVYPKIGIKIFRFWVFVFAFVGMQLAWNLRPFLGDKYQEFELFREKEGNFYLAIIQSTGDMFGFSDNADDTKDTEVKEANEPPEDKPVADQPQIQDTTSHGQSE